MTAERGIVRYVSQGVYAAMPTADGKGTRGFVRAFETGITEAIDTYCFREDPTKRKLLLYDELMVMLWTHVRRTLALLAQASVSGPHWLLVSLLGIRGHILASRMATAMASEQTGATEEELVLPAAEVPEATQDQAGLCMSVGRRVCHGFGIDGFPDEFHRCLFKDSGVQ